MIYALIIAALGVIVVALATLVTFALRANSRLTREKNAAMRALEEALAGKEALKAENGKLQQELHFVQVENADLSESLRAGGEEFEKTRLLYGKLLRERNDLEARNTALSKTLEAQPTMPAKRVRKPQTTE